MTKEILSVCQGAHSFNWTTSDYLFFVKGNRERVWFKGKYGECANLGCPATQFFGNKKEYFIDKVGDPGPDNIMLKEEKSNASQSEHQS